MYCTVRLEARRPTCDRSSLLPVSHARDRSARFAPDPLCPRPRPRPRPLSTAEKLDDERYMREALRLANEAASRGDVPVGALVVLNGAIIGTGFNIRERRADPAGHAEIVALRDACRSTQRWRVDGATLYVTLEPCPMCAGALVNARVRRLVYGADDPKAGAVRSLFQICDDTRLNHRMQVRHGVLAEACATLLSDFFRAIRERRSQHRRPLPPIK